MRRRPSQPRPQPLPVRVERLEGRRLFSTGGTVTSAGPPERPAAHAASLPASPRVRPFDDEGDAGGSSGTTDAGGTGAGDASGDPSDNGDSSDVTAGGSFDAGDAGGTPAPVDTDTDTTTGGGDAASTGTSGGAGTDDGSGDATVVEPTGDAADDGLDDDAGGGTVVVLPPAQGAADFGGAVHVRLPAHPVAGDAGLAVVDVFNTGGRALGRMDITVGASPDGTPASAVRLADDRVGVHLGHDRVAVYRLPFTLPATLPAGTYRILAVVDAANDFDESSESNNVAVGPAITVAAAVDDVAVSVTAPATVHAGRPATVAVQLKQVGTAAESGPTTITVTLAPAAGGTPQLLATVTRPVRIGPLHAATVRVRVSVPRLAAGRYVLTLRATSVSAADADAADKSVVVPVTLAG